ncbi:unnamed protein product [Gordionus sp. m RMFG-2023]
MNYFSTSNAVSTGTESVITKLKSGGKNFFVFYGSQTGTAESFANRLVQDARKYGLKSIAVDPEECDIDEIPELISIENNIVLFIMATYGEGDPTDNARDLYELLENSPPVLNGLNYSVFGLGNKTYEHYNAMGKFYDKKLEECGAKRISELGLGDDDSCIEEDFMGWKEKFWEAAEKLYDLTLKAGDGNNRQYKLVTYKSDELLPEKIFTGEYARLGSYKNQKIPYDSKNPFLASIQVNKNIFKSQERKCMHIELDITGSRLKYEPGDHIAIYPQNDKDLVDSIGHALNIDLDQIISLVNLDDESNKKNPFPCPCSYKTALTYYLDITSPLRTNVLKDLAKYTMDEKEKDELLLMSQYIPEGKLMYAEKVIKEHLDILSLLQNYPSLKAPLDHICELLPRLQQRYYSISSSPKIYPDSIHITAVVLEWKTPSGKIVKGVATNWLSQIIASSSNSKQITRENDLPNSMNKENYGDHKNISTKIPIYVRRSQFKLPLKKNLPIIMIGPGTGLAPFRGFLQHKKFFKDEGKPMGQNILFFGCRNKKNDYIYEEELGTYKEDGVLSELFVAFSRDQPQKIYVTDLMKQNRSLIWDILDKKLGHIYICGDAKNMAKDVNNILLNICENEGKMTEKEAEVYIKNLHTKSRYQSDVWS